MHEQLTRSGISPGTLRSWLIAIPFLSLGLACSGTADKWTGSVDAVFRYRPGDRSTLVYEIRPGTAAEQAGLQSGDRILAVDGDDVTEAPFEAVRAAMRGPVGSVAILTIQRDNVVSDIEVERRPLREDQAED